MSFFSGSSRFGRVKRSGSPTSAKGANTMSELDKFDELNDVKASTDVKPAKNKAGPASPSSGDEKSSTRRFMTESEKHAVLAMVIAGNKPGDIAKILGLTTGAVRMFLRRRQQKGLDMMKLDEHASESDRKTKTERAKK